jgi:putative peptide zinc metalloprotease protein
MFEADQTNDSPRALPELRLAPGLELLPGQRNGSLLFVSHRGVYLRLSDPAAEVIRRLADPACDMDLMTTIKACYPGTGSTYRDEFVHQLIRAGAIVDSNETAVIGSRHSRRISWNPRAMLPLRFRLFSSKRMLTPIAIRWNGSPGLASKLALITAVPVLLGASMGNLLAGPMVNWRVLPWSIVLPVLVLHVMLHECSHGLACFLSGIRVREAGIAILYWFLPVFYVDRTDSYRLPQRWRVATLSLAGPFFDICAAGLTAIASVLVEGEMRTILCAISTIQTLMFLTNLNPFLPSDGLRAIESLTGCANTRRRAMSCLGSVVFRRALPSSLRQLSTVERRAYCIYGTIAATYILMVLWALLVTSRQLVHLIVEHL